MYYYKSHNIYIRYSNKDKSSLINNNVYLYYYNIIYIESKDILILKTFNKIKTDNIK